MKRRKVGVRKSWEEGRRWNNRKYKKGRNGGGRKKQEREGKLEKGIGWREEGRKKKEIGKKRLEGI